MSQLLIWFVIYWYLSLPYLIEFDQLVFKIADLVLC